MGIMTKCQKQTAVYWAPASDETGAVDYDGYGQPQYADPIQITCRLTEANEQYIGPDGTPKTSQAKMLCSHDVVVGGVVMEGVLSDVVYEDDPKRNDGAWEIVARKKILNLKATEYIWKVWF